MNVLGQTVGNPASLAALLAAHGIPVERWGTGEARSVGKLYAELADGECTLALDAHGVRRDVIGVAVHVRFTHPQRGALRLVEDRQVYRDGRVVRRALACSIGEKCRPGEASELAARRGLIEELGIRAPVTLTAAGDYEQERASVGYPGLRSRFITDAFTVELEPRLYRDLYIEEQPEKRSFFLWRLAA